MPDRLEHILEDQLAYLLRAHAMMSTGTMSTRSGIVDTTLETIAEYDGLIRQIEEALRRHRSRNA
jgi:hypothetical protein